MAIAMRRNDSIIRLKIRENSFGDDGVIALAVALRKSQTIIFFSMFENEINDRIGNVFLSAFEENFRLQILDLNLSKVSNEINDAIERKQIRNWALRGDRVGSLIISVSSKENSFNSLPKDVLKIIFQHLIFLAKNDLLETKLGFNAGRAEASQK